MSDKMEFEEININGEDHTTFEKSDKEKVSNIEEVKRQLSKMSCVVKTLESSLSESEQNDKQLVMALRMDNIKNQRLTSQLEEARKENKQILNALQQQYNDNDISRSSSRSQIDTVTSCSTVSMVHLQYKYEELMVSHENLLKILESRVKEVQNAHNDNNVLRDEIENLSVKLSEYERKMRDFWGKFADLRNRKNLKIRKLRHERNTLRLAHNQLSDLLTKQCMQQDRILLSEMHRTGESIRAQLLNEVRKTNRLQHENSELKQEILYLQEQLNFVLIETNNGTSSKRSKD